MASAAPSMDGAATAPSIAGQVASSVMGSVALSGATALILNLRRRQYSNLPHRVEAMEEVEGVEEGHRKEVGLLFT